MNQNSNNNENECQSNKYYNCKVCDFVCSKKSNYEQHLLTRKHNMIVVKHKKNAEKMPHDKYMCMYCKKTYTARNSYWYHKQKCKHRESLAGEQSDKDSQKNVESNSEKIYHLNDFENVNFDEFSMDNASLTKLFLENIRENREFQKQMFELLKDNIGEHHNTINSNNKTMNNQFNLNFFLNETCKDAMNINEFIDYVTVNLDDFENFGKVGYPKALGEIIVRNLNELDVKIRPIHCSDLKREVLHVKHDGVWHSDDSQKFIKRSITYVANKNIRQRPLWQDENPESKNCLTSTYERFNNICLASLGPATDEQEADFLKKITSTIAREVVIDKKKKY
jgi:hypothetical protein